MSAGKSALAKVTKMDEPMTPFDLAMWIEFGDSWRANPTPAPLKAPTLRRIEARLERLSTRDLLLVRSAVERSAGVNLWQWRTEVLKGLPVAELDEVLAKPEYQGVLTRRNLETSWRRCQKKSIAHFFKHLVRAGDVLVLIHRLQEAKAPVAAASSAEKGAPST